MPLSRPQQQRPVTAEMADYNGYRYMVGGGSAFFLGLLTAGLYPGVAVITRLRRHRADESRLYLRMVDRLRQRFGGSPDVDRVEALADRMRRNASRGVLAILTAVALGFAILATGPALLITYESHRGYGVGEVGPAIEYEYRGKGEGAPAPYTYQTYQTYQWGPVGHRYHAVREVLDTGVVMTMIVGGLLLLWVLMALVPLAAHRRRTVALIGAFSEVAQQRQAPPVRVYPAGLTAGQVFWLITSVFLALAAGLGLTALLVLAYPGLDRGETLIVLMIALTGVVLPLYVWVAMVWSNHARRWDKRVMGSLSESLSALLQGAAPGPALAGAGRLCRSPECGTANRPLARYCCRCGQPL